MRRSFDARDAWMRARIAAVVTAALWLPACVLCKNEVLTELPSPSGKYVAKAGKYGCRTNTGFYGMVEIRAAGPEPLNMARCGDPGTGIANARFDIGQRVDLRWESDQVLVVRVTGRPEIKVTQTGSCANDTTVKIRVEQ